MTSKILRVLGIERLGHQVDLLDLGRLAVGGVALGARGRAELIVFRKKMQDENRPAGLTLVDRVGWPFLTKNTVQDRVAHCSRVLPPIGWIVIPICR